MGELTKRGEERQASATVEAMCACMWASEAEVTELEGRLIACHLQLVAASCMIAIACLAASMVQVPSCRLHLSLHHHNAWQNGSWPWPRPCMTLC